jgi:phage baseplate assembly protein W
VDVDVFGNGWAFPVVPGPDGAFKFLTGDERIRQSIWLILATTKGERVMLPEFGCGIHDLVFQPNTPALRGLIRSDVIDAMNRWEPRIDVIEVEVVTPRDQPNMVLITLDYRIRATNAFNNLVYPLFINEGVNTGFGRGVR